eukprot:Amastigsp_a8600_9.p3 type:complete len:156 gc:universal Amastigsp_a8600_9:1002-535(-)
MDTDHASVHELDDLSMEEERSRVVVVRVALDDDGESGRKERGLALRRVRERRLLKNLVFEPAKRAHCNNSSALGYNVLCKRGWAKLCVHRRLAEGGDGESRDSPEPLEQIARVGVARLRTVVLRDKARQRDPAKEEGGAPGLCEAHAEDVRGRAV